LQVWHAPIDLAGIIEFLDFLSNVESHIKFAQVDCGTFDGFPVAWNIFTLNVLSHHYDARDRALDFWSLKEEQQAKALELMAKSQLRTNAAARQAVAEKCYDTAEKSLRRLPLRVAGKEALLSWLGLDLGFSLAVSVVSSATRTIFNFLRGWYYQDSTPALQDIDGLREFLDFLKEIQKKEYFSHLSNPFLPFPDCWLKLFHWNNPESVSEAFSAARRADQIAWQKFQRSRLVAGWTIAFCVTAAVGMLLFPGS